MSFFSTIFSKFLDQYIEKVDKNQVDVSLLKGHAELHNVSFTQNLLTSFGIPLAINDSHADQIIVDFPIMKNNSKSTYFQVTGIDIYATPEWSALNKVSINSVADLIQSIEDEKKATKADKQKVWNSWIEKVIDNAKIDIRNVRLHIEFDNYNNKKGALTLFFESLMMNTVDSEGKIVFLKEKPEILRKRIKLTSFSIALYTDVEPFQSFKQLDSIKYNFLTQSSFSLTMIHDRRKNSNFFNTFSIVFGPIFFYIRQEQYFSLQHLINDLMKSQIRQKFQSCMKPSIEKVNLKYYIKMWSFLYRCAIKMRRPHQFNPSIALQFLKKKKEYAKGFMSTINRKQFVKKSIKNNGEELTFLLIQYSSILIRRKERMISLNQKEIDSITSDDLRFFSKDSFQFNLNLQGICFELHSFLLMSVNNINCLFEKKNDNIKLNLEIQNWIVDDLNSKYKVIQTQNEENNFVMFRINSRDDPALFDVSKFKIDLRSSFLKNFCQFFVNNSNSNPLKNQPVTEENVKMSSINQFLIKLNPKTLMKFKIRIRGFSVGYSIDNGSQHSFQFEINHIELKNFSKKSNDNKLEIKSKMIFGEMKVDDSIISEEFSFKTKTTGIIDKFYFLNDLVTNLDILNAKIDIDSSIIDKINNILNSIANSTQSNQTKVYSSHKIYANCADISILINSGINLIILSISGIDINPSIEFRNISILEKDKDPKINIPTLCFNEWPIIKTDLLNIKLNSYEFFDLLDEVNWITKQITKLSSSFMPKNSEIDPKNKEEEEVKSIQVVANLIDYKMGDRANSMKFNNVLCILDDEFNIKIDSLGLFDSENKEFLFCKNKIDLKMNSIENKNSISIKIPDLKMNFLWNEINQIIEYFQDSRNLIEQNLSQNINKRINITKEDSIENINNYQNEIFLSIEKSSIDIENSFLLLIDDLNFEFLISDKSSLLLEMVKIDIDNLLEVNEFHFQIDDFIYDISISSINANLSQSKALKISELSFLPSILSKSDQKQSKSKEESQIDLNISINNFSFKESSTNLTLLIPVIKITMNSYHSIGAIHIPSINFENLVLNEIKIFLLYNSINFNNEEIDSIFSLDRKKLIEENEMKLTNIIASINSIDFEYAHYFVMRIFNAYKIYSKYFVTFSEGKNDSTKSNISISAIINQIMIRESNLNDSISLSKISFKQDNELTEFKCNSISFIDLLKLKNENFLLIQKNQSKTNIKINPIDVYLSINTLKTLTNIYESLMSLIKTDFDEKSKKEKTIKIHKNERKHNCYDIDVSGIQIHFPFEDDPLFKKHDLILSFDLQIQIESNSYKLLKMTNLKAFFTNIKKEMRFLPILLLESFSLQFNDNNDIEKKNFDFSLFEIKTGTIDLNVSAVDIFELQMIINNFIKSFNILIKPKTFSIPDENKQKKFLFSTINSMITIKPLSISLCEENRASNVYNPIFTLNIDSKNATLNLQNQIQSFSIELTFSISSMNLNLGKIEKFMPPTDLMISYSNGNSDTAYVGLSIKTAVDFNFTSSSFQNLMKFIRKFRNKEKILLLKNESKFNYNPEYWIQNNLDDIISIQFKTTKNDGNNMIVNVNDHLPICELEKDTQIAFKYKGISEVIFLKNIIFPIYYDNISVSTVSHKNSSKSVVFNSPLSIQNKLDCKIIIYIKEEKQFIRYIELLPKNKYPLPFEEKQYFIVSTFESINPKKHKKKLIDTKDIQFDSNQPPESFVMSLNKSPQIVKIQNIQNKKLISFVLNVNNDHRTKARVYEITPSLFIKNLLPCPIFSKIDNSEEIFVLQSQDEKQLNSINHDNQSFSISVGFDSESLHQGTVIKLDNDNGFFPGDESTAIQIQKVLKTNQKKVVIFTPCAIFNNTEEAITFSPSSSSNSQEKEIKSNDFVFYGLNNYNESEKSLKIDMSIEKSQKILNAIDCMQLTSNCSTVYLPRIDNPQLFYPLNCSITLGQFPLNATHIVTFSHYLYVINNLPFDFSLVPITSAKVGQLESNIGNIDQLLNEIEIESQILLKDSFIIPHSKSGNENCVLIKWMPKDGMFLFSVSNFPNNPIIQLNGINRTVFVVENRKEKFFIELNIYEDKSTLYAHFQVPAFPVPLVINNSLDTPIFVYQNIKPVRSKQMIDADSSSLFAFKEPFINSRQICIEIAKPKPEKQNSSIVINDTDENTKHHDESMKHDDDNENTKHHDESMKHDDDNENTKHHDKNMKHDDENAKHHDESMKHDDDDENTKFHDDDDYVYIPFLFSMEEQLSPLISEELNVIATTTVVSKNNSIMIQVRRLDDAIFYESSLRGFFSIRAIRVSLSNDQREVALFTMKEVMGETCQDSKNTFLTLSIQSIQIDNQKTNSKFPVFLVGNGSIFSNEENKSKGFFNVLSIFPRGVPLFTVINFMSIKIEPILIVPETSMVIALSSFVKELFKRKNNEDEIDAIFLEPSFRSVTVNKTLIAYLEICPIRIFINIPSERTGENYYVSTVMKLLNMISLNKISIITPKLFVSEFGNNISYLVELLRDFYGNEVINQITKYTIFKFVANSLIRFKFLDFIPLSSIKNDNNNAVVCDNRKPIFCYFNEIELNDVANQSNYYFDQTPDVISQLLDSNASLSNILIYHPNNQIDRPNIHSNKDRLIIGIQSDSSLNSNLNNLDLIQIFQTNNIKRERIPIISPIFSSFEFSNSKKFDEIYLQLQSEILKDKKLENQNIKFVIESSTDQLIYCVTNEMILCFELKNELFQISQKVEFSKLNSISSSGSTVSLKSDDQKIGQIVIQLNSEVNSNALLSFIATQQKVLSIFGFSI
ncbi:hypothetical protein M9Y10_003456 [Tritrichomonas musculus]|uniref:Chorein N-terminal domain-containing protein n=1 Tax=Tritrichomonas musculus TaxID=1915356 RepID=A0ABR2JQ62_9EUKA